MLIEINNERTKWNSTQNLGWKSMAAREHAYFLTITNIIFILNIFLLKTILTIMNALKRSLIIDFNYKGFSKQISNN